jgi:hypothetical protein
VRRLGGRVELQSFVDLDGPSLALDNVIAHWGRMAGGLALCAHWDTRPWCDHDPDSTKHHQPLPGANDGGSGVAVLLEVAELLHRAAPRSASTSCSSTARIRARRLARRTTVSARAVTRRA